ncbi:hypothetical protein GGR56DRAFT_113709 [Xylariaceae sp. FL0804]|nr:hypothetical protein GGR56DRAFT_113709 [Xylariaceae sp. FL0804]
MASLSDKMKNAFRKRSRQSQPQPQEETGSSEIPLAMAGLLAALYQTAQTAWKGNCAGCATEISYQLKNVIAQTKLWAKIPTLGNHEYIALGLKCPSPFCTTVTCPGCGGRMKRSENPAKIRLPGKEDFEVFWCCDHGRLALIWALACGWDDMVSKQPPRPVARAVDIVRRQPQYGQHLHVPSFEEFRELELKELKGSSNGTGYGGSGSGLSMMMDMTIRRHMPSFTFKPVNTKDDGWYTTYFGLLSLLLPNPSRQGWLDTSPPELLIEILARSPLMEYASTMLENDSVDELGRRSALYSAIVDFVATLGTHIGTGRLVHSERSIYTERGGLQAVSTRKIEPKSDVMPKDTGRSLGAQIRRQAMQASAILKHAGTNPGAFRQQDGVNLLGLSRKITALSTLLTTHELQQRQEMDVSPAEPKLDLTEWHRSNCVQDFDDGALLKHYAFVQKAMAAAATRPHNGRMKRLITELSSLRNSLPEGIYIRHGASRLDIMKILIIGPVGTPYEHGFFEFDLFCPFDYPKNPPHMRCKTTANGRIGFNPNLYPDGTICLSLLGTWAGEPWRSEHSTLLQVLVSIQSMILCEKPWYNEPGREGRLNEVRSNAYNLDVRSWTQQFAIMPWMKPTSTNAPTTSDLWAGTIALYLRVNGNAVMESARQAAGSAHSGLQTTANFVINALREKEYST